MEFIVDGSGPLRDDGFYFMEMNTRLQVEHPVTEEVTGHDLVELQLRVAAGGSVPEQDQIALSGWAMEARLYAEDPATGFLPSIGKLERLALPKASIRVDTGVERGGEVSLHYDPMIAKLISRGATRDEAISTLIDALDTPLVVHPVKTNAGFLRRCLDHADFKSGSVDTHFIDARLEALAPAKPPALLLALSALAFAEGGPAEAAKGRRDPWAVCDGFRVNAQPVIEIGIDQDGERLPVELSFEAGCVSAQIAGAPIRFELESYDPDGRLSVVSDHSVVCAAFERRGRSVLISAQGETHLIERFNPAAAAEALEGGGAVKAPMPGKLLSVPVVAGDSVTKGQTLAVLEAMKMEHALAAPRDGVVEAVNVAAGDQVGDGDVLVTLADA